MLRAPGAEPSPAERNSAICSVGCVGTHISCLAHNLAQVRRSSRTHLSKLHCWRSAPWTATASHAAHPLAALPDKLLARGGPRQTARLSAAPLRKWRGMAHLEKRAGALVGQGVLATSRHHAFRGRRGAFEPMARALHAPYCDSVVSSMVHCPSTLRRAGAVAARHGPAGPWRAKAFPCVNGGCWHARAAARQSFRQ